MAPPPNYKRTPVSSLDAHMYVEDADALAAEFSARGVRLTVALHTNHDGRRGFVLEGPYDCGLFFGGRQG